MSNYIDNLSIVMKSFNATDGSAFVRRRCSECTSEQMGTIAYGPGVNWLRCVVCGTAHVLNRGELSPASAPLTIPTGVVGVELAIWKEARRCLGLGAYTAAVMLCRKLLFHVAVGHGLPPKNDKDRAPSFMEAIQHLESEGLITKRMRPWVDRIKDVGNDANHEITPVGPDVALDVATFTEQLLRLTYEMEALMTSGEDGQPPPTITV
jgi:ribosomal protein S27E